MEEINLGMISAMKQQAGIHSDIVSDVIAVHIEAVTLVGRDPSGGSMGLDDIAKFLQISHLIANGGGTDPFRPGLPLLCGLHDGAEGTGSGGDEGDAQQDIQLQQRLITDHHI